MERRQGELQAQQQAWMEERRMAMGCPDRTNELVEIQVGGWYHNHH